MAPSFDQFRNALLTSQLLSEDELHTCLSSLPADRRPTNGEQLARELVRQNHLTAFQAQAIYKGQGQTLVMGNYIVIDKLGEGGMGTVLKAQHRHMKRLVALKVISSGSLKDPGAVKRFHREVEAAARLSHPNIVTAFDAAESKGTHYLVMEYVEGTDLSQMVKTTGPSPVDSAVLCILQAAQGLQYAHSQGVIHRDIKPSNLLLDRKGTLKILDMGLARLEDAGEDHSALAELTATGAVMGTVDYMSPEQAVNTKDADARSDIYSLGCTLHYLLLGRPVYPGSTLMERLLSHREQPIPSLCSQSPNVPEALDHIFRRMLAKRPQDRYQSMRDVIVDLEKCQRGEPVAPPVSATSPEDSRLHNFLQDLRGNPSPGVAPSTRKDAIVTTSPPRARAQKTQEREATLASGSPHHDTDPHTLNQPIGSAQADDVAPWWKNRKYQLATGIPAGVIGCLLLFAALSSPDAAKQKNTNGGKSGASPNNPDAPPPKRWPDLPPGAPQQATAPFDSRQAEAHQKAWADFLKVPVEFENNIGMQFSLIPPGEFKMGSSEQEVTLVMTMARSDGEGWEKNFVIAEIPQHPVRITRPFYIGRHEVTHGSFNKFVKEQPNPKQYYVDTRRALHPIGFLSIKTIDEYCQWLEEQDGYRYRLPTEAEWEYACRAGTIAPFAFGEGISSTQANFNGKFPFGSSHVGIDRKATTTVGSFKPNPFGLYDMHGNLWEVCSDLFDYSYYRGSPPDNPPGPEYGNSFVIRGGDYENSRGFTLRSSMRYTTRLPQHTVGFRLVREIDFPKSPRQKIVVPSQAVEWRDLMNRKNLDGWTIMGHKGWNVEKQILTGETSPGGPAGWLMSNDEFEDFELDVNYKMNPGSNSGIFLRAWPEGDISGSQFTEVQLLDDDDPKFAAMRPDQKTGAIFKQAAPQPTPKVPTDQWHKLHIRVVKNTVQVTLNGKKVVDHTVDNMRPKGHIGLQLYPTRVEFRHIRIKEF
ncbi:MAG: protein kinase domain-containing protein [Planctomycetaceae bacterium]